MRTVLRLVYRARATLNCSAMYMHSVLPFAVGVGQLAERASDELAGALLVLEGERDDLAVGEHCPAAEERVFDAGAQPRAQERAVAMAVQQVLR